MPARAAAVQWHLRHGRLRVETDRLRHLDECRVHLRGQRMHFRRERPAEDAEGQRSGVEQHLQEVPQQRSCHRDGRRLRRITQRLEGAVRDVQTQVRQQSPSAYRRPARIRGKSCRTSTVAVVSLSAANPSVV